MPEIASIGKYCPQCHLMTRLAEEKCQRCGHQFRTGESASTPSAGAAGVDPLNKTQMFMRSPVSTSAVYTLPEAPNQSASFQTETAANDQMQTARAQRWKRAGIGLLVVTSVFLGWFLWSSRQKPPQYPATVFGTWANDSASVQMNLMFLKNGSGVFAWTSSAPVGTAPFSGPAIDSAMPISARAPLRWRQDNTRRLHFAIQPSAAAGTVPGALIEALNSRSWEWQIDSATNILKIGPLRFKRVRDMPYRPVSLL